MEAKGGTYHLKNPLVLIKDNLLQQDPFFFVFSLGIAIRTFFVLRVDFPINDGGMFYKMTQELIENNFRLPLFTSYNHANIPFAYPPLAFYLTGFLSKYLGFNLLQVFRFFPLAFSILTIFIFYLLSREFFSKEISLFATLIFSTIPRSYEWQIMGGGVTRSLGMFFHLLTLYFIARLRSNPKSKHLLLLAIFSLTAVILSHPEWAFFTVGVFTLFAIFGFKKRKVLKNYIYVLFFALLFSSIWWVTVARNHGSEVFFNAARTGLFSEKASLINLAFAYRDRLSVLTLPKGILFVSFFGFFLLLFSKKYIIPLWFVGVFLLSPRSGVNPAIIVLSLVCGYSIYIFFVGVFKKTPFVKNISSLINIKSRKASLAIIFSFFILYGFFLNISFVFWLETYDFLTLSDVERQTLFWIRENTETKSKFLVITPINSYSFGYDYEIEWFPALAERVSIATPQGMEWLSDNAFYKKLKFYNTIKDCYGEKIACFEDVVSENGETYDYVYISKHKEVDDRKLKNLLDELRRSENYLLIYENLYVAVFKKII